MNGLDPERQEKARQYARAGRRLWLVEATVGALFSLAWVLFGWSRALEAWLTTSLPVLTNPWLMLAAFLIVFGGSFAVLNLPLNYYGGYVLPHRFDQSTQTLRDWITDQVKGLLIGAPLGLVLLELLYFALRAAGEAWWLWAAAGMLVFNVLLANLAPILIAPLFNKYSPLGEEHSDLEQRLLQLAERAHTRVRGVFKFDMSRRTKAANAALTGIGNTRRIIVADTMIREFSPDEIETVLAHELGHHVHRDILIYIAAGTVMTGLGLYAAAVAMKWAVATFGFAGVSDPAALPALGLILGAYGLLTMPAENALSRWRESLADRYSLEMTGKGEAFASAFVRLANQNLSEADPQPWVVWLFYSHPPLGQRIRQARQWGTAAAQPGAQ